MIFKLDVNEGIYVCREEEGDIFFTNRIRAFQRKGLLQSQNLRCEWLANTACALEGSAEPLSPCN